MTEPSENTFRDAGRREFDRYRDRYQNGNLRTNQDETDIESLLSERIDTWRMLAYVVPPNSGPGGSLRVESHVISMSSGTDTR